MTWGSFIDPRVDPELHLVVGFDGEADLYRRALPFAHCHVWPHEGFPPKPRIGDVVYHAEEDAASIYVDLGEGPAWIRLLAVSHTLGATREVHGTVEVYTSEGWVAATKYGHFWVPANKE